MDENKELVETMEDYAEELEASFKRLHEGDIVTGTVVAVTDDQVLVDLKYFAQGVIDRENLSNDPDFNMKEEIQPGDLLTATVIQTDDGEGRWYTAVFIRRMVRNIRICGTRWKNCSSTMQRSILSQRHR